MTERIDHVNEAEYLIQQSRAYLVSDAPGEVEIFGPTTATPAILGGLVSDFRIFIVPKIVGGGLRAIPDGANLDLSLVEHHPFDSGAVYFHYRKK